MLILKILVSVTWLVAKKAYVIVKTVFIAFLYLREDTGIEKLDK